MLNHPNKSIVGKLSLLAMVVIMVFGLGGGTAIAQVDAPQQEAPAYLITTGLPNLQSIEIPSMLDDEAAQRLSGKIMVKRSAELRHELRKFCLLYTSDAADDLTCVGHGGGRIV